MGMCGCSDIPPDWKIPGPDGSVYAIHLYTPCNYCENPGGVVLSHLTRPDDIEMFAEDVPELKLETPGLLFPVLDVKGLRKMIKSGCGGLTGSFEGDEADVDSRLNSKELAEAICDELDNDVETMVFETFSAFKTELQAR